jgi:SPP1 gp7 family putative phage head morphogenesis protein
MARVQGWTETAVRERERVFEALVAKATRLAGRRVAANLNAALTAAVVLSPEPDPGPPEWQPNGGVVAHTWNAAVDAELLPYVIDSFVDSAADVHGGLELAGVAAPKVTYDLASDYLAAARNRLVGVGDLIWNAVRVQLSEGYAAGESTHQLAARIRDVVDVTAPRANTIARTEVVSAVNAASLLQMKLAGFTDVECLKRWIATEDERTRPAHYAADGQAVPLSKPFQVGGEGLQFPGDPTGRADNVINCRCTLEYEFSDDGEPLAAAFWNKKDHPRDAHSGEFVEKGVNTDLLEEFESSGGKLTHALALEMQAEMRNGKRYWREEQAASAEAYASYGYKSINGLLRGTAQLDPKQTAWAHTFIQHIHEMMNPSTRAITVYRGVRADAFGVDISDLKKLEGTKGISRGFMSTSIDNPHKREIQLQIHAPRGTPMVYLDSATEESDEHEMLLADNLHYQITRVVSPNSDNEPWRVDMEVIP